MTESTMPIVKLTAEQEAERKSWEEKSMVEKVALALRGELKRQLDTKDYLRLSEQDRDRLYARAAIEAMREPTYAMAKAIAESQADSDEGQHPPLCDLIDAQPNFVWLTVKSAWRAGIDAALQEETR